ncbi:GNAT family N-acetyltransferase [Pedobacter sp. PAMC26386]|nr:GNAT family N-acetyltransferase [Pedobacter sp. PAMC26386]
MQDIYDDIITSRLVLRLIEENIAEICLSGDLKTAGQMLGITISEELLENIGFFEYGREQLKKDSLYRPWSARAVILPEEKRMIGIIRFHSRPDPEHIHAYGRNAAELGYGIFTPYQRQGYATEAVSAMMNWARQKFGTHRFLASVSPENKASLRLVYSFGFTKVDEVMDEVDGMEHVFLKVIPKD